MEKYLQMLPTLDHFCSIAQPCSCCVQRFSAPTHYFAGVVRSTQGEERCYLAGKGKEKMRLSYSKLSRTYLKGAFKYNISAFWGDGGLSQNAHTANTLEGGGQV